MEKFEKLSIVIPVFNEEKTINLILDKIISVKLIGGIKKEIIIVDDYSTDKSELVIKAYIKSHDEIDIRYFKLNKNSGKGCLLYTSPSPRDRG